MVGLNAPMFEAKPVGIVAQKQKSITFLGGCNNSQFEIVCGRGGRCGHRYQKFNFSAEVELLKLNF